VFREIGKSNQVLQKRKALSLPEIGVVSWNDFYVEEEVNSSFARKFEGMELKRRHILMERQSCYHQANEGVLAESNEFFSENENIPNLMLQRARMV